MTTWNMTYPGGFLYRFLGFASNFKLLSNARNSDLLKLAYCFVKEQPKKEQKKLSHGNGGPGKESILVYTAGEHQ